MKNFFAKIKSFYEKQKEKSPDFSLCQLTPYYELKTHNKDRRD